VRAVLSRCETSAALMTRPNDVPLTREQQLLTLASGDMRQAAAAARILDQQTDFHARRALETAIAVCYARPWIDSNKSGKLKHKWRPAAGPDRDLHNRLLKLRRQTYAHTDPGGGRTAFAQRGSENTLGIGELWESLRRDELRAIIDLCERQAARFRQAVADEIDGAV
jgi:hypothetical protein